MAGKVKTWVWIVVGIAAACVIGLVAVAAAGVYFVTRHMETRTMTAEDAAAEFEVERGRFAGQVPIIELDSRGEFVRAHTNRPVPVEGARPSHLHVMAYDPSDAHVVRFRVPFWVLKMGAGDGTIEVNGSRLRLEDLRLTPDDLERFGPSLVLDHTALRGERVLVWSQ